MMNICSLCGSDIDGPEIFLEKTYTLYSKSLLLLFLQKCVKEEVLINNYLICNMCYSLVNELDRLKVRTQEIEHQLNAYLNKYVSKKQKNVCLDELTIKNGSYNVCNQKIYARELEPCLKTNNDNVNVLDDNLVKLEEITPILHQKISMPALTFSVKTEKKHNQEKTNGDKSNEEKPFNCTECSKTWKTATELKKHLLSHSEARPFICEICGQAYKRQQALAVHIGMHKGINPFTCIYCKKSFTQKGALVRHMPIHTGKPTISNNLHHYLSNGFFFLIRML